MRCIAGMHPAARCKLLLLHLNGFPSHGTSTQPNVIPTHLRTHPPTHPPAHNNLNTRPTASPPLQVELNTIASSFGCLSTLVSRMHAYLLGRLGAPAGQGAALPGWVGLGVGGCGGVGG